VRAATSPLALPRPHSPLIADARPTLQFVIVERESAATSGEDQHPGADQLIADVSRRPRVPRPGSNASGLARQQDSESDTPVQVVQQRSTATAPLPSESRNVQLRPAGRDGCCSDGCAAPCKQGLRPCTPGLSSEMAREMLGRGQPLASSPTGLSGTPGPTRQTLRAGLPTRGYDQRGSRPVPSGQACREVGRAVLIARVSVGLRFRHGPSTYRPG
jgi:hypothetical protein